MLLCEYGCGQEAKFQFKNGRWCCCRNHNSCKKVRERMCKPKTPYKKSEASGLDEDNIFVCDYGCNQAAKYQFKNGKKCCSKLSVLCPNVIRNRNSIEINKSRSEKQKQIFLDQEARSRRSQTVKKAWQDPKIRKKYVDGMMRVLSDPKVRERRREISKQVQNKPDVRKKKSIAAKEVQNRPAMKELRRDKMLNGWASYVSSFNSNPSKPQVDLFNLVKELYEYSVLNYPIYFPKCYSIDIAIPELSIAIEYDEPYWHSKIIGDDKDIVRQHTLEELGWKFLRYRRVIPILVQLKNDINSVLLNGSLTIFTK